MIRIIFSSFIIGVATVFLLVGMLDADYRSSINWVSILAYCAFWYGIFGSVLWSGVKAVRKQRGG